MFRMYWCWLPSPLKNGQHAVLIFSAFVAGSGEIHATCLQVSRTLRFLHVENVLEENANVSLRGLSPQGPL